MASDIIRTQGYVCTLRHIGRHVHTHEQAYTLSHTLHRQRLAGCTENMTQVHPAVCQAHFGEQWSQGGAGVCMDQVFGARCDQKVQGSCAGTDETDREPHSQVAGPRSFPNTPVQPRANCYAHTASSPGRASALQKCCGQCSVYRCPEGSSSGVLSCPVEELHVCRH